jgi:DNA-directed RNA polymerase subunit alpha
VLCTLDEGAEIRMEVHGRHRQGLRARRAQPAAEDAPIGLIPGGQPLFAREEGVVPDREHPRGQMLDFDKLTMTVETNGAVTPEDAVAYAARIIQDSSRCS